MINNDKEFRETIEEYLKSKGIELDKNSFMDKFCFCNALNCEDCVLNDIKDGIRNEGNEDELFDICTDKPFQDIKKHEEKIRMLKQEISIMSTWKREREMAKELKDICRTFRGVECTSLSDLTCYGITCDKCPFKDMDNFKEWARKAKEDDEECADDDSNDTGENNGKKKYIVKGSNSMKVIKDEDELLRVLHELFGDGDEHDLN